MGDPPVNELGFLTQVVYRTPLAFTNSNLDLIPTTENAKIKVQKSK
jgi:hypothetical protein